jgi:hypothetical protein
MDMLSAEVAGQVRASIPEPQAVKVLFVEDDTDFREALAAELSDHGFAILHAGVGLLAREGHQAGIAQGLDQPAARFRHDLPGEREGDRRTARGGVANIPASDTRVARLRFTDLSRKIEMALRGRRPCRR